MDETLRNRDELLPPSTCGAGEYPSELPDIFAASGNDQYDARVLAVATEACKSGMQLTACQEQAEPIAAQQQRNSVTLGVIGGQVIAATERATPKNSEDTSVPEKLLSLYMHQAKQRAQLSQEQEAALTNLIGQGVQARQKLEGNAGDEATAHELEKIARAGDEAKKQLVEANLAVAVATATPFANRSLPLPDLIQEANCGLLHAAEHFDPSRGVPFGGYAKIWAKKMILEAITERYAMIRVPRGAREYLVKMQAFSANFLAENDRRPTDSELVDSGVFTAEQVDKAHCAYAAKSASLERISQRLNMPAENVIENAPQAYQIPAEDPQIPVMELIGKVINETFTSEQTKDHALVLALHYGIKNVAHLDTLPATHNLEPGQQYNVEKIAPAIGASRATASRRLSAALDMLRDSLRQYPELAGALKSTRESTKNIRSEG